MAQILNDTIESLKLDRIKLSDLKLRNKTLLKLLAVSGLGLLTYKTISIYLKRRRLSHLPGPPTNGWKNSNIILFFCDDFIFF